MQVKLFLRDCFKNVEHFKSVYWIWYTIAAVLYCGFFDCKVYRILAPWPGIELAFPALEGEVLIAGPLRESLKLFLISSIVALCFAFSLVFSKVFQDFQLFFSGNQEKISLIDLGNNMDKRATLKWSEVKLLSHVRLLAMPWTTAYQALPSMGFSRQEYWSWVPLPSPFIRGWEGSQPSNSFFKGKGITWLTTFPTSNKYAF